MRISIIADTITANQVSLVLDGSGTCENLPGILTTLWPVGYDNDGIVLQLVCITTPNRETQIVTRQEQNPEPHVFYHGMLLAWLIETILTTITKQMVFIIIGNVTRPAINKIVPVFVNSVRSLDGQTSADGALKLTSRRLHPLQRDAGRFVLSDMSRLCGKSSAPHLRKHIQIAVRLLCH